MIGPSTVGDKETHLPGEPTMTKRFLLLALLIVAGLFVYNYMDTARITLIPSASLSAEERRLRGLEDRLQSARKQFLQASRAAALSGVDTTADAAAAKSQIDEVAKEARELRARAASDTAKQRVGQLEEKIREARREIGLE